MQVSGSPPVLLQGVRFYMRLKSSVLPWRRRGIKAVAVQHKCRSGAVPAQQQRLLEIESFLQSKNIFSPSAKCYTVEQDILQELLPEVPGYIYNLYMK